MTKIRIGCSGWAYKDWTGPFYPAGTRDRDRLDHYVTRFETCEINASFYRLPTEAAIANWRAAAPPGFVFAWKVSRFISHNLKLRNCEASIALVFGRMRGLGPALGPALIQLPPMLKRDPERLAAFADLLPRDVRCAVEFRRPDWYDEAVFDVLRSRNLALCVSDHHHAPSPWLATADFVYVRGHGPEGRYAGRYGDEALDAWAARLRGWGAEGRDAYVFFDNDVKSAAPLDAERLRARFRTETSISAAKLSDVNPADAGAFLSRTGDTDKTTSGP